MAGNVQEWVADRYGPYPSPPPDEPLVDPTGPLQGDERVARGGSFEEPLARCRTTSRRALGAEERIANLGFRLCVPAP